MLKVLPDHKLIRAGIYKHIRHPCYLAMILYSLGIPLLFSSLYGFLIMLLLIPCVTYRMKIEERMLIKYFGEEYIEYMKETKRIVPYVY
ncbi:MAG: methyltransferase family protein [Candidatus Asgardarchaeia archaeon]